MLDDAGYVALSSIGSTMHEFVARHKLQLTLMPMRWPPVVGPFRALYFVLGVSSDVVGVCSDITTVGAPKPNVLDDAIHFPQDFGLLFQTYGWIDVAELIEILLIRCVLVGYVIDTESLRRDVMTLEDRCSRVLVRPSTVFDRTTGLYRVRDRVWGLARVGDEPTDPILDAMIKFPGRFGLIRQAGSYLPIQELRYIWSGAWSLVTLPEIIKKKRPRLDRRAFYERGIDSYRCVRCYPMYLDVKRKCLFVFGFNFDPK